MDLTSVMLMFDTCDREDVNESYSNVHII